MAKQKVALECLSYHATASHDQTVKLVQDTIQSAEEYSLYTFNFVGKFCVDNLKIYSRHLLRSRICSQL